MTEREYLLNRLAVETRLATKAADHRAAAAHRAMAAEYRHRLATTMRGHRHEAVDLSIRR